MRLYRPVHLFVLLSVIFYEVYSRYATPEELTAFFIQNITDTLPPLEDIHDCDCPRIYIPVCGSNNKTYTNICYMNCLNMNRTNVIVLYYMGSCMQFLDPFEY
ncbi:hypothetical protein evm_011669 [Chilo suppressalis]|nr:hypothetical protein evm_011669 [Chilo suppressalis]